MITKNKIILALAVAILPCIIALSAPAFRIKLTISQSDGTNVTVVKGGDESLCYYSTTDGFIAAKDSDGVFRYVCGRNESDWIFGKYIAHNKNDRTSDENAWLASVGMRSNVIKKEISSKKSRSIKISRSRGKTQVGNPTIPVILAQYADLKFTVENTVDTFYKHFNAENYTGGGGRGSVRDYFMAQSNGKYTPDFDILGIVTLSRERSYYGNNNSTINDVNANRMIREAVELSEQSGVDFSKYRDANGRIPTVAVIYAGVGEQSSNVDEAVWAKYMNYTINTAGGTIYSYVTTSELFGGILDVEPTMDGIGTFCHEFSHFLGLPDFYNTNDFDNIFGLDFWSIMDYGQYWANGKIPMGYTSYERNFMGWMDIDTLKTQKQTCSLNALGTEMQNAYYIINDSDDTRSEYYILENRQPSVWYPKKLGSGMLVFHVDYDYDTWANNEVNNDSTRQRMTIIPADGQLVKSLYAIATDFQGDLFPGITNNTNISDDSSPSFSPYRCKRLGKYISSITETDGIVTFCYMARGVLNAVDGIQVTTSGISTVAVWNTVENAQTYSVTLTSEGKTIANLTVSNPEIDLSAFASVANPTITVVAQADDYVDSPTAALTLDTTLGADEPTTENDDTLYIYTTDGILTSVQSVNENVINHLPKGVYIIKHSDGHTIKKMVK